MEFFIPKNEISVLIRCVTVLIDWDQNHKVGGPNIEKVCRGV